ncbi:hypothetical protein DSP71_05115 [Microbacterium sp. H6]|nr:hypothetical protein DSP71_05115 [Microbacterium sp. H6]
MFAIRGGSPELQGWDAATVVAVRTHNLIASLVQGLSGEKDPAMFIDWPGRDAEKELTFEPKTIAELLAGALDNFMNE